MKRHAQFVAAFFLVALVFASDGANAQGLTFVEALFDGVAGVKDLESPRAIAVSPDGASVYAASFGGVDGAGGSLVVFSRDIAAGTLTFVESFVDGVSAAGLAGSLGVTVSPDGAHVYATGFVDNSVMVFSRDPLTSALVAVQVKRNLAGDVQGGMSGPIDVAVSPDGLHLYVTAGFDDSVVTFSRDVSTGELSYIGFFGGVVGGANKLAIDPDSNNVYVTGTGSDTLVVLSRDVATGLLAFVEAQVDGVAGVDGLAEPVGVGVSPDGAFVYVASRAESAISIFSRDAITGTLAFQGIAQNGFLGVVGLTGAETLAVAEDALFAAASGDEAVVSFVRDPMSGALTYADTAFDDTDGVDGLGGANGVALSPNPHSVYVAGQLDQAIAVFTTGAPPPPPPPPVSNDLTGQTITYQARFGGIDGQIADGPTPVVVGDEIELPDILSGVFDLDFSATNARLLWNQSFRFSGGDEFNGHIYSDGSGVVPAFQSVTVNPETTLSGFDSSRVAFDDDNIWVDYRGLGFTSVPGTVVSLDITLVPTPEPGSAAVVALLSLVAIARRRQYRC